ncbi:GTP-binding protein [Pseudomonas putida]|nr:GTP-binding protein [Pseudomonas putida]NTZ65090.1 GTP-binding protein [Pseudomonas putida]NTZ76211.1 GTP-binding protein [Pseudomonas putida]NTZ99449.1 GTP-binding protein [Pseudomonas putida]
MRFTMINSSIPIVVVTGFLGAGKTTFLRSLIEAGELRKTLFIVNEIGEVGLDQQLLQASGAKDPILLSGGCLCCEMKNDLGYTLRDLYLKWPDKANPPIDKIVIETSGLASPASVILQLAQDHWLRDRFRLSQIIGVIDSEFGLETLTTNELALDQVIYSDTVFLSKQDKVNAEQSAHLTECILRINPRIKIKGVNGKDIKSADYYFMSPVRNDTMRQVSKPSVDHLLKYSTTNILMPDAMPWRSLASALDELSQTYQNDLLRVKGVVYIKELTTPIVIHGVRGIFMQPEVLVMKDHTHASLTLISAGTHANVIAEHLSRQLLA